MANFLSSLTEQFQKFTGPKKATSVLGIDIGSSSIKVVQLALKNGHPLLETYGELALGPYAQKGVGEATNLSVSKVVEALKDVLKEKEVNITTKTCGIAIPFSSSLMAVMELPNVPQKQLAEMVPLEARRYIPVPIAEVTLDWYLIPKDRDPNATTKANADVPEKQEALIVALHNDTVNRYKNIVTDTQLESVFFEIEIFSTIRSILDNEVAPILVADMGATSTKLYIIEKGIVRSSHMVNYGSQSITNELSKAFNMSVADAEILKREKGLTGDVNGTAIRDVITVTLNYIFSEANHFLLAYQKKYNKTVSKVVLVGGGSALKGLVPVAKTNFQTNVVAGDPFSKVVAPAFLESVLKDTGPEFAVAVGVALRCLQETS